MSDEAPPALQGWLRKSHAGLAYRDSSRRRYFTTVGFHVYYYADEARTGLKGHFDLRNVVELAPVPESVAPDAVMLRIAERSLSQVAKSMVISFSADPASKPAWLKSWCSAVSKEFVDKALHEFASPDLSAQFDRAFGGTRGVGSRRSLLKAAAPQTDPLTPRAGLDTPRAGDGDGDGDGLQTYEVTVPAEAEAGDKLKMTLPTGQEVQVTIPEGAVPGSFLSFELPLMAAGENGGVAAAAQASGRLSGGARSSDEAEAEAAAPAEEPTMLSRVGSWLSPSHWRQRSGASFHSAKSSAEDELQQYLGDAEAEADGANDETGFWSLAPGEDPPMLAGVIYRLVRRIRSDGSGSSSEESGR